MTEQQFKRKLITRTIASAILFATSAAIFLYFTFNYGLTDPNAHEEFYAVGFLVGVIIGGLVKSIMYLIILKSPKLFKKRFIMESDERNRQISLRAWAWSGYISIFVILISTLFLPVEVVKYLLYIICMIIAIYAIVYRVLKLKM